MKEPTAAERNKDAADEAAEREKAAAEEKAKAEKAAEEGGDAAAKAKADAKAKAETDLRKAEAGLKEAEADLDKSQTPEARAAAEANLRKAEGDLRKAEGGFRKAEADVKAEADAKKAAEEAKKPLTPEENAKVRAAVLREAPVRVLENPKRHDVEFFAPLEGNAPLEGAKAKAVLPKQPVVHASAIAPGEPLPELPEGQSYIYESSSGGFKVQATP